MPHPTEDQLAIMRTISRLAQAQDDGDRETYKSLFTDPVNLTASPLLGSAGPMAVDELADRYFAAMAKYAGSQHNVFNHVIDVDGDEASCSADFHAIMKLPDTDGGGTSAVSARYNLQLVRHGAAWLISARDVSVRFQA